MKRLLMLIAFAVSLQPLFAQQLPGSTKAEDAEYAVVFSECSSFGGYCIFYEDGTSEDYFKTHNIKRPAQSDTKANATVLLDFLKYMRSKGFLLVSTQYISNPSQSIRTTQYIFSKTKT